MVGIGFSWPQKYAINVGAKNVADGNIRFFGIGRGALWPSAMKKCLLLIDAVIGIPAD